MSSRVFTWDWRGQPDMGAIGEAVNAMSAGTVHMAEVKTGTDGYAWVVADHPLSEDEAEQLWRADWDDEYEATP